jgi:multisubunit Na+/H+ antiporter MnhB subunit
MLPFWFVALSVFGAVGSVSIVLYYIVYNTGWIDKLARNEQQRQEIARGFVALFWVVILLCFTIF